MDAYERVNSLLDELTEIIHNGHSTVNKCEDWISVNDMLPGRMHHKKTLLGAIDNKYVITVEWNFDERDWYHAGAPLIRCYITHWMKFPSLPAFHDYE